MLRFRTAMAGSLLIVSFSAIPAAASGSTDRFSSSDQEVTASTEVDSFTDDTCLQTLPDGMDPQVCQVTVTTDISEPETVPLAELRSQSDDSALVEAAALKSRAWTQTSTSNLGGLAWTEKHSGTFYYDGNYAWIKEYKSKTGYHSCDLGQSIGYTIKVKECSQPGGHPHGFDLYDRFQVNLTIHGIGLKSSQCMNVHPNGDGTLTRTPDCR